VCFVPPANFFLKVLFAYRSDVDAQGGTVTVMEETAKALRNRGVEVDITYDLYPDAREYDLVHVFDLWKPRTALAQLKHLRKGGTPVVWSPFFKDWSECTWAGAAVDLIYAAGTSQKDKAGLIEAFARGDLEAEGMTRWTPNEASPGFRVTMQEMLALVDHVCVASWYEIKALSQFAEVSEVTFSVAHLGVDAGWARDATPELFHSRYKVKDFILCAGPVERWMNQLLLIEGLRDAGLQIVLAGSSPEPDYLDLCLKEGGKRVLFTGKLDPPMAASAFKAAAVHALPSFAQSAPLASLEAAAAECPMAASNRSCEFEYLGDAPFYCSPNDPTSIGKAVMLALDTCFTGRGRWKKLAREVEERFTWDRTAEIAVKAYERVLGGGFSRKKKAARAPGGSQVG
jgi:glycosyltransferase involved in cell wall biosynthesis